MNTISRLSRWVKERKPFALAFVDLDRTGCVGTDFGRDEAGVYITETKALLDALPCILDWRGGDEFILLGQEPFDIRLKEVNTALAQSETQYRRSFTFSHLWVDEGNALGPGALLHGIMMDVSKKKKERL